MIVGQADGAGTANLRPATARGGEALFMEPPFPTNFDGPISTIEIHYDVKRSARSQESPVLILNFVSPSGDRSVSRTARLGVGRTGSWKGRLPTGGKVFLNIVYDSCVSGSSATLGREGLRFNLKFNHGHKVESSMFSGSRTTGKGTCG
ncbi:hypothetical protein F8S09_15195 [Deinococcus sp. SDU3-2]|uniref:Uncharacterized protein n=1 Tax=Deinococcus terrestris TaxID=2651870 RepID=A0A7X1TSZ8_9DEIO|nr:hypothetical protein [Deinococcus terrestris]MPY68004.1 hypothetical protein [Deinococcus terrestris]